MVKITETKRSQQVIVANTIADGQYFFGTINGSKRTLWLKTYSSVVCLINSGSTFSGGPLHMTVLEYEPVNIEITTIPA